MYTVYVRLTGSEGSVTSFLLDVTLDYDDCDDNLDDPQNWLTSYTYNIGQPSWWLQLSDIDNSDCPYSYTITRQSTPGTLLRDEFSWMGIPDPIWTFPAKDRKYENTQASWSIYTQDVS